MLSGRPKYSWRVEAGKPGSGGSASPLVVGYEGIERVLTPGPAYRIGRDPKGDIPITDDRVSWHHAELRVEGSRWVLVDVGSTNGTYVADQRMDRVEIIGIFLARLGDPSDGTLLTCVVTGPEPGAAPGRPARHSGGRPGRQCARPRPGPGHHRPRRHPVRARHRRAGRRSGQPHGRPGQPRRGPGRHGGRSSGPRAASRSRCGVTYRLAAYRPADTGPAGQGRHDGGRADPGAACVPAARPASQGGDHGRGLGRAGAVRAIPGPAPTCRRAWPAAGRARQRRTRRPGAPASRAAAGSSPGTGVTRGTGQRRPAGRWPPPAWPGTAGCARAWHRPAGGRAAWSAGPSARCGHHGPGGQPGRTAHPRAGPGPAGAGRGARAGSSLTSCGSGGRRRATS